MLAMDVVRVREREREREREEGEREGRNTRVMVMFLYSKHAIFSPTSLITTLTTYGRWLHGPASIESVQYYHSLTCSLSPQNHQHKTVTVDNV